MVNKYAYDEFGTVLNSQEGVTNPFKYVGQFGVMDEGNGLHYMRARYYDRDVGRFISKDPIGYWGGMNLYGYVGNNPVNWIDPEGTGPILFRICLALVAADTGYTIYELNKYAKEQEEISRKIQEISSGCNTEEDLLKRQDEIEDLRKQMIKAARNQAKARIWGYASGGAIVLFCAASMLPLLP
jgi:RHS repeat-associated protein